MTTDTESDCIVVRRFIHAPPERVFAAWSDPGSLRLWMCPGPVTHSEVELDFRVGGSFRIVMVAGEQRLLHSGTYTRIEAPQRLDFTWISAGTDQCETAVELRCIACGADTEVVLTHRRLKDRAAQAGHTNGWLDILACLDRHFGSQPVGSCQHPPSEG